MNSILLSLPASCFRLAGRGPLLAALGLIALAASNLLAATNVSTNLQSSPAPASTNSNFNSTNTPAANPKSVTQPAAPRPTGFDSFRMVTDRNIFNPNRSKGSRAENGEVKKTPKIETIALVGTIAYAKGTFAFFDSSNSEFKKSLKQGDSIAGYQVQAIVPGQVTLQRDGEPLALKIGHQLKREDGGPWQLIASTERIASSATASTTSTPDADASTGSGGVSDILKKLMEKRAKELNP